MKRFWLAAATSLLVTAGFWASIVYASFTPNDLTIIAIKMTSLELMVVQNTNAATISLNNYQVQYFNQINPPLSTPPTNSVQLPAIDLLPNQTILLNSDSSPTCGAAAVADLPFSLSDSAGYVRLVKVITHAEGLLYSTQDDVNWSTTGAGVDISSSSSPPPAAPHIWFRVLATGVWGPKVTFSTSDCTTILSMIAPADTPTFAGWADGSEPPVVSLTTSSTSGGIPAADIGLASPQITELLPNPAPPESDSEDEFIELYNSNTKPFDLSGFKLEAGTSNVHSYTFPSGTTISPKSFKAFYSGDTGLSLTNSTGQARLIDPLGNIISQTENYSSAKNGQSWALASGKWYWSNSPTPAAANSVNQTGAGKPSSASSSRSTVRGVYTPAAFTSAGSNADNTQTTPLHAWTLAAVAGAALLYAGYEYRTDLANHLYRLRRYIKARRTAGK